MNTSTNGSAYAKAPGRSNERLTQVGPGTPCGKLMRRYWQPIALSAKVTTRPQAARLLGEDLILFRDPSGRAGLLHSRCAHRGTTLYYGRVEERGIRCCYHGWLFDVEGNCLEQPCERGGGINLRVARQPWYPVEERYGLVFAYMGPLDRKPLLPRYDTMEDLEPDEILENEDESFYIGGGPFSSEQPIVPMNYLQVFENVMDAYHVYVLHTKFTGTQFRQEFGVMPEVTWDYVDHGVAYFADRRLENGNVLHRITQVLLPNVRCVPTIEMTPGRGNEIAWFVPVDDTHVRTFGVARARQPGGTYTRRSRRASYEGRLWSELSPDEHQIFPGDYEAQLGQGTVTLHSEEHLVGSDRGIILLRKLLDREMKAVAEGKDPIGTAFDGGDPVVRVRAGNYYKEPVAS